MGKKDVAPTGPALPSGEQEGVDSELQSVMSGGTAAGRGVVARGDTVVENNNNNNTVVDDKSGEEEGSDEEAEVTSPSPVVETPAQNQHSEPSPAGVGNRKPRSSRSGETSGPSGGVRTVSAAGGVTRTNLMRARVEASDDEEYVPSDPRSRQNRLSEVATEDIAVTEEYKETWQITVVAFMNNLHYGKTPSVARKWIRTISPYDLQDLLKKVANFCVHGPHGVGHGGTDDNPKRDYALSELYPGLTNMVLKEIGYVMAEVYINRGGLPRDAWFMRVNGGNLWPYSADDTSGKGNAEHRNALAPRNSRRRASNA